MRVLINDKTETEAWQIKEGDVLVERRTGEERKVVAIARTLTEFSFLVDDGTWIDAEHFDRLLVKETNDD